MKNKIISGRGNTYERLSRQKARKLFEEGKTIYVMSADRDPVTSLTSEIPYRLGGKSINGGIVSNFDELLCDFSEWLYNDGYGHIPQRYAAKNERFSYWIIIS